MNYIDYIILRFKLYTQYIIIHILIYIWLTVTSYTGWWFGSFFLFFPIVGMMIQSDEYFSRWLKPPTRYIYIWITLTSYILWMCHRFTCPELWFLWCHRWFFVAGEVSRLVLPPWRCRGRQRVRGAGGCQLHMLQQLQWGLWTSFWMEKTRRKTILGCKNTKIWGMYLPKMRSAMHLFLFSPQNVSMHDLAPKVSILKNQLNHLEISWMYSCGCGYVWVQIHYF